MAETFENLQAVLEDERFPGIDHRLRSGGHIDLDEVRAYELLVQAEPFLVSFYDRYDCRLINAPEGYFYLLSEGTLLGQRRLTVADMLVGQVLALMFLDSAQLKSGGRVHVDQVLAQLELIVGQDPLAVLLAPRRRGRDRETDNRKIREDVEKALRTLERLGFILLPREAAGLVQIRRSILRFIDPVRRSNDLLATLRELIRQGSVAVSGDDEGEE